MKQELSTKDSKINKLEEEINKYITKIDGFSQDIASKTQLIDMLSSQNDKLKVKIINSENNLQSITNDLDKTLEENKKKDILIEELNDQVKVASKGIGLDLDKFDLNKSLDKTSTFDLEYTKDKDLMKIISIFKLPSIRRV